MDRWYIESQFRRGIARMVDGAIPMSSQPCGCDPEENNYLCEYHAKLAIAAKAAENSQQYVPNVNMPGIVNLPSVFFPRVQQSRGLSVMDAERKALPIFTGVLMYFPDALLEVARVSRIGNDQHNPGEPLHWAREKSTDQMNTATRHMLDHGMGRYYDVDGAYHIAKAAWRLLAELQLTIERDKGRQHMQEIVP